MPPVMHFVGTWRKPLRRVFWAIRRVDRDHPYAPNSEQAGSRALRNVCLGYLLELDTDANRQLALQQFEQADNMTDQFAALSVLANINAELCPQRDTALAAFYQRWQDRPLLSTSGWPCNPPAAARTHWRWLKPCQNTRHSIWATQTRSLRALARFWRQSRPF